MIKRGEILRPKDEFTRLSEGFTFEGDFTVKANQNQASRSNRLNVTIESGTLIYDNYGKSKSPATYRKGISYTIVLAEWTTEPSGDEDYELF